MYINNICYIYIYINTGMPRWNWKKKWSQAKAWDFFVLGSPGTHGGEGYEDPWLSALSQNLVSGFNPFKKY